MFVVCYPPRKLTCAWRITASEGNEITKCLHLFICKNGVGHVISAHNSLSFSNLIFEMNAVAMTYKLQHDFVVLKHGRIVL